jgi:hypothetical protein
MSDILSEINCMILAELDGDYTFNPPFNTQVTAVHFAFYDRNYIPFDQHFECSQYGRCPCGNKHSKYYIIIKKEFMREPVDTIVKITILNMPPVVYWAPKPQCKLGIRIKSFYKAPCVHIDDIKTILIAEPVSALSDSDESPPCSPISSFCAPIVDMPPLILTRKRRRINSMMYQLSLKE